MPRLPVRRPSNLTRRPRSLVLARDPVAAALFALQLEGDMQATVSCSVTRILQDATVGVIRAMRYWSR